MYIWSKVSEDKHRHRWQFDWLVAEENSMTNSDETKDSGMAREHLSETELEEQVVEAAPVRSEECGDDRPIEDEQLNTSQLSEKSEDSNEPTDQDIARDANAQNGNENVAAAPKKRIAIIAAVATAMVLCLVLAFNAGRKAGSSESTDAADDAAVEQTTNSNVEDKKTPREFVDYEFESLKVSVPKDWEKAEANGYTTWRCVEADHGASFSVGFHKWTEYGSSFDAGLGEAIVDSINANTLVGDRVNKGTATYDTGTMQEMPTRLMTYNETSDGVRSVLDYKIVTAEGYYQLLGVVYHYTKLQEDLMSLFKDIAKNAKIDSSEAYVYIMMRNSSVYSEEVIEELEGDAVIHIHDALEGKKTWGEGSSDSSSSSSGETSTQKGYQPGVYMVGSDLPAGEYALYVEKRGSHAYFCVYPDASKSDILENSNFDCLEYITVSDGQIIEVRTAYLIPAGDYKDTRGPAGSGRWRIGIDIPAGTYSLELLGGESHGYYAVYDSSEPGASIVQNNNFESNDYVTVVDGQYLELRNCLANLKKDN